MAAGELTDAQYVEIVDVVVVVISIDSFCRGIGVPLHPLPEPEAGEPSRYRPAESRKTDAWVPTLSWGQAGAKEADLVSGPVSNIRRALTLVPDESRHGTSGFSTWWQLPQSSLVLMKPASAPT